MYETLFTGGALHVTVVERDVDLVDFTNWVAKHYAKSKNFKKFRSEEFLKLRDLSNFEVQNVRS